MKREALSAQLLMLSGTANELMVSDTHCPTDDKGQKNGACVGPHLQAVFLQLLPSYVLLHLSFMLSSIELVWDPTAGNLLELDYNT